jgi:two-component system, sensor histidine kinase RegB
VGFNRFPQICRARAGGAPPDPITSLDVSSVFEDLRMRLPPEQACRVEVRISEQPLQMAAPKAGLLQVLLSLVTNAFDAAGTGTPVVLEGIRQAGVVQLIVRDQGPGMSDDVLRRAGEPFYTTKAPGRGMGLGLFLARMFAERCGGTLTLRSERGTIAVLELPLSADRAKLA